MFYTTKTYKLTNKIKSIINRKCDKWSLQNAYKRVKFDLNISRCFMGVLLSLFKGDLEKIYKELNQVKSNCDIKLVAMLATMIKDKFTDDKFLTGENRILFVHFAIFLRFLFSHFYSLEKVFFNEIDWTACHYYLGDPYSGAHFFQLFYHLGDPYSGIHFLNYFIIWVILIQVSIFKLFYHLGDPYSAAHLFHHLGDPYSGAHFYYIYFLYRLGDPYSGAHFYNFYFFHIVWVILIQVFIFIIFTFFISFG